MKGKGCFCFQIFLSKPAQTPVLSTSSPAIQELDSQSTKAQGMKKRKYLRR